MCKPAHASESNAIVDRNTCTKICTLHPTLQICVGCGRDLSEIARWSQLSASERAQLMGVARQRLAGIARPASA